MAGTALPDWLSVVDRKLRLRPKMLEPFLEGDDLLAAELAAGALQHLADDDWFHRTRGFAEVTAAVGLVFRRGLAGSDGFRCGFLGHIVTEMLLDAVLITRYPAEFKQYDAELQRLEPAQIAAAVEKYAGRPADSLAMFISLFQQEKILLDYAADARLLWRLNQVLKRVKLTPLPAEAADWIAEARWLVDARRHDLLPDEHYAWPSA